MYRFKTKWLFVAKNMLSASLKLLAVQVNFLTKLVALKPGKVVLDMIRNVMLGKDEGADNTGNDDDDRVSVGFAGRVS
jgi:hypothetical protein